MNHIPLVELTTTTPLIIGGNPAQVLLRYDKRFATTATIDNGVGAVTGNNGTITVPAPATTTVYTLTGTHAGRNPGDQLRGEVADRGIVMAVAGHQPLVLRRDLRVDLAGLVGGGAQHLAQQRIADDHLSLVAGLRRSPALVIEDSTLLTPD